MQRNSLKFILLLAGAGILIALTCLISGLAYYIGQKKITDTYIAQMHGTVSVVGQQIDDFFTNHANVITMAAKDPRTIASVRTRTQIADGYFKELKDLYGVYDNVYAHTYGNDPTVVTDAGGGAIGYKLKNEELDPEELKRGKERKYFVGKPILNPITNLPVMTITYPVYDGGQLIGNAGIALSLQDLTDKVLKKIRIGQEGYVVVTTKAGILVATKDKELILKYDLSKDEAGSKMLLLKTGEDLEFTYQEKEHIATTYHLDNWGMMIIAVQPKGEINSIILELLLFIGLSALAIAILSVGLLYMLLNKRLNPLEKASLIFRAMATGDLTSNIEVVYEDEIGQMGQAMNSFIDSLRGSLKDIQRIALELASASEELTSSSQSFATGAQSTAASSEQMSATVEEMSAGMENIAVATDRQYGNILDFHSKIKELSESARKIGVEIENTLNLTKSISIQARKGEESVQGMSKMIENILHSSGEMTAILSIINEISDQTQLLALNAAIEAARAGEAGRGFAVVADEISKLAEKTASSINSIGSMITKNNEELDSGANAIRSSAEIIHSIMQNIDSVAEAMNQLYAITEGQQSLKKEVDQGAEKVGSDAEAVKLSTDEQKRAVREITSVITQINEHTLNTASGSEEMSSSAQNLATTAELLRSITEKFKI